MKGTALAAPGVRCIKQKEEALNMKFAKYRHRAPEDVVEAAKVPDARGVDGVVINGELFNCGDYVIRKPDGSMESMPSEDFESSFVRARAPRKKKAE